MIFFSHKHCAYFISLILSIALVSCEQKNDENLVPSYIHIENIASISSSGQGSASSNITDAWVYIDETLIGSFELPATIPILASGMQNITIRPGIKMNGISNTRIQYPFYTDIKRQINLVKDSVINLSPLSVSYEPNVTFPWIEDFESSVVSLDTTKRSTVGIKQTSNQELIFHEAGNSSSAYITMTNDTSIFEVFSTNTYQFPENGGYVFLEMNYKLNHPLVVGVSFDYQNMRKQNPMVILNPTDEWKKIYINLSVIKYDTPSASNFKIFIGAEKIDGSDDAVFLLDNIKLVHFNTSK